MFGWSVAILYVLVSMGIAWRNLGWKCAGLVGTVHGIPAAIYFIHRML